MSMHIEKTYTNKSFFKIQGMNYLTKRVLFTVIITGCILLFISGCMHSNQLLHEKTTVFHENTSDFTETTTQVVAEKNVVSTTASTADSKTTLTTKPVSLTKEITLSENITVTPKAEDIAENISTVSNHKGLFGYLFKRIEHEEVTTPSLNRIKTTKKEKTDSDYSDFDDAVFVGNSRVETIGELGLLPQADVFAKVGLNIRSVYDEPIKKGQTALQLIKRSKYGKVILVFGDNECGWPYTDVFIDEYSDLIDTIQKAQPNAKIYLQSVLPISRSASAKEQDGMNQKSIDALNVKIKKLASDKGVGYFGTPAGITDSFGYLKEDAASDGIHFGKKYCLIWIDYMKERL